VRIKVSMVRVIFLELDVDAIQTCDEESSGYGLRVVDEPCV
jgi:hypothetical protein